MIKLPKERTYTIKVKWANGKLDTKYYHVFESLITYVACDEPLGEETFVEMPKNDFIALVDSKRLSFAK